MSGTLHRASVYSAWERSYVTPDHGGTAAVLPFVPIEARRAAYDVEMDPNKEGQDVPLLRVHGVWDVGGLALSWAEPTSAEGEIVFTKSGAAPRIEPLVLTVAVPKGSSRAD